MTSIMGEFDLPQRYDGLSEEKKQSLHEWITSAIQPASREKDYTSYGLKHDFEHDTGIYVDNGEFKGAMEHEGYKACNPYEQNWTYKIKRKSNPHRYSCGDGFKIK